MTIQLKPLTNRADDGTYKLPADGFYQVVPRGRFLHKPTGLMQIVDDKSINAQMAAFADDKAKKAQSDDPGVLLSDYDHFSGDTKLPSKASGWIHDLENREDGIYAKIDWTPDGHKDVTEGNYRYASPTFKPEDVEFIDAKTIRPLRLDRIGITNDPNIKTMKPLSNRSAEPLLEEFSQRAVTKGALNNAGNSDGARKGWITRHQGLASVHANLASEHLGAGRTGEAASHQALAEKHLAAADELKRKGAAEKASGSGAPKRAATKADLANAKSKRAARVGGRTREQHLADAEESRHRGIGHAREYDRVRLHHPEDRAALASASKKMKEADDDERASRAAASKAGARDRANAKSSLQLDPSKIEAAKKETAESLRTQAAATGGSHAASLHDKADELEKKTPAITPKPTPPPLPSKTASEPRAATKADLQKRGFFGLGKLSSETPGDYLKKLIGH